MPSPEILAPINDSVPIKPEPVPIVPTIDICEQLAAYTETRVPFVSLI